MVVVVVVVVVMVVVVGAGYVRDGVLVAQEWEEKRAFYSVFS